MIYAIVLHIPIYSCLEHSPCNIRFLEVADIYTSLERNGNPAIFSSPAKAKEFLHMGDVKFDAYDIVPLGREFGEGH